METNNLISTALCASLLCPLFLLSLSGCAEEPPPRGEVVRPVKMLTIGSAGSGGTLEYPGSIAAAETADLAFEVAGKIEELPVIEGQEVAQGELLARLDGSDYKARLASAQAERNKAKADFDRGQSLRREDSGAIAQVTLDSYRQALEVGEARLLEAQKAVDDTVLRAAFAGRVARKLVSQFENVQAKQPILVLQSDTYLEIDVNVPERDAIRGRQGVSAEETTKRFQPVVVISALPDRSFPARFKSFSTSADPVTRTFKVTLAFDKPEGVRVLPGMTAKIVIDASRVGSGDDSVLIPSHAARTDVSGEAFVWVVDVASMKVGRRAVELGDMSQGSVGIRSGLQAGDTIATSGVHHLREGMKVRRFGKG
ncbi:MAG: RND family efflux transporter MFP subunit [Hyphomicrobiaceae bacterium]|jgi:RND family efflux transporter MFP subunit